MHVFSIILILLFLYRNLIPHLLLEEVLIYHKGYLNVPNLKSIEEQIEERKLYYAQEDNDH